MIEVKNASIYNIIHTQYNNTRKMCVENQSHDHFTVAKPKNCKKFTIYTEQDLKKTWFVNITSFEENGQVGLCHILLDLRYRGLTVEGKKFYMPKFKVIVKPCSMCKCSFTALDEKQIVFRQLNHYIRMYPVTKDDNEIFQIQNEREEVIEPSNPNEGCFCKLYGHAGQDQENFPILDQRREIVMEKRECLIITPPIWYDQSPLGSSNGGSLLNLTSNNGSNNILGSNNSVFRSGIRARQIQEKQEENHNEQQESDKSNSNTEQKTIPVMPAQALIQSTGLYNEIPKPKPKELQRIIKEVISLVKIWRGLHQQRLANLTAGANVVGLSKKSLDDYYLILRVGEVLGFNFQAHLDEGMGQLRNFIRTNPVKVTGKLGKRVRCFDLVGKYNLQLIFTEWLEKNGGNDIVKKQQFQQQMS